MEKVHFSFLKTSFQLQKHERKGIFYRYRHIFRRIYYAIVVIDASYSYSFFYTVFFVFSVLLIKDYLYDNQLMNKLNIYPEFDLKIRNYPIQKLQRIFA